MAKFDLGKDLSAVGIGYLPPLAPLVGPEDALALEVQPQDAEAITVLWFDLDVEGLALEGVILVDAVVVGVSEEATKDLDSVRVERLKRRVLELVVVLAHSDPDALRRALGGLHPGLPVTLDILVEE